MLHIPYFGDAVYLFKKKFIGDAVDRLISFATAMLCAICSAIIVGKQLMGSPMTCWITSEFRGDTARYALDYCYIQNTYVLPNNEIDASFDRSKYTRVNYYQWLSLYFILQAIVFFFPSYLWRKWYKNNEIDVTNIIKGTKELRKLEGEEKERSLKRTSLTMVLTVKERDQDRPRGAIRGFFLGGCSYLLTYQYLFMKLMNLTIVTVAISQVSDYLDHTNFFWSIQGIQALLSGTPWVDSSNFPRVTMCDLRIRTMANWRNATVQCLLGMNYINEKLFFVEWIWLFIVLCVAAYNVLRFSYTVFMPASRIYKLQNWLNRPMRLNAHVEAITHFSDVIGLDGFLTLYFIECHNGSRAAADFGAYLYQQLRSEIEEVKQKKSSVVAPAEKKWPAIMKKMSFSNAAPLLPTHTPSSAHSMELGAIPKKHPV